MSQQLAETLRAQAVAVRAAALEVGVPAEQRLWLFPERTGGPRDPHNVRRAFARILKHATLPAHLTPHCLRHTFASILLAEGKSPAYVQAQLGHKSIAMTVDTYGRWLPKGNKAAIDSLDDPCTEGTPEVGGGDFGGDFGPAATNSDSAVGIVPQDFRELITNGPCWTRTNDPLLKRSVRRRPGCAIRLFSRRRGVARRPVIRGDSGWSGSSVVANATATSRSALKRMLGQLPHHRRPR